MKDNTFNLTARGDEAEFMLAETENAFIITVHNLQAEFTSEYTRVRESLLTASGHSHVVCNNVTVSVEIKMTTLSSNDTNTTGRQIWGVETGFIAFDINKDNVDFTFSGNVWANVIDWLQGVYLPIVIDAVEATMVASMHDTLPPLMNFYFYEEDGYLLAFDDSMPKFEQFIMDFSTDRPFLIDEAWTGLTCRGLWFDKLMGSRDIEPA